MKEGKASVWIVVPFTVGVAAVSYSLNWFYAHYFEMRILLVLCLGGVLGLGLVLRLRAIRTNTGSVWQSRAALLAMFLLAGTAVSLLSNLPADSGAPAAEGVLPTRQIAVFAERCGEKFREMIGRIPFHGEMTGAMVKALLAGDRSGLSWEVRRSFRGAGASHLLALSGLHLSVIYLIFSKALSLTGNSPVAVKLRSTLIVVGSAFFTLMTGASPSLVRAFLFILLRECAAMLHRRAGTVDVFCMSLMLQLAVCPGDITSVGFQLSYIAVLGIVAVYPPLEKLWDCAARWRKSPGGPDSDNIAPATGAPAARQETGDEGRGEGFGAAMPQKAEDEGRGLVFGRAMRKIWSLCTLSVSCQLFTAPVVLLRFGTFPRYFLITNLFCLPLSTALITVSVIDVALYPLGLCPGVLLSITDFLVRALLYVLEIISSI